MEHKIAVRRVAMSACCLALTVAVTGCGSGQATTESAEATSAASAIADKTKPKPRPAPEPHYAPTISGLGSEGFSFSIRANVTLGKASTSTTGEEPGEHNIIAPVSGSATLTNDTRGGYDAEREQFPAVGIVALYPAHTALCRHDPGEYGDVSDGNPEDATYAVQRFYAFNGEALCSLTVAVLEPPLAASCGGYGESESLSSGESLDLTISPDGGSSEGSGECSEDYDPGYLVLGNVPDGEVPEVISTLSDEPPYWAVRSEEEANCPQAAYATAHREGIETYNLVPLIQSQPDGLSGCILTVPQIWK